MENKVYDIKEARPAFTVKLGILIPLGLAVLLALFMATGFYTVDSGEEAVILRFGNHVDTVVTSGLNWHIPVIDSVWKEKVSEVKRLEFGFRTLREGTSQSTAEYQAVPRESLMLTGDENLVNVETIVQFRIVDIENYLFQVSDAEATLRVAAESVIRRVIANHPLDAALTENKFGIQQEIRDYLQGVSELYNLGLMITAVQLQDVYPPTEVNDAFRDVASAREDRAAFINQAETYANEVIPQARGNAAQALNRAQGFKEQRIAEATGDVAMFNEVFVQYQLGKEVTRTRLYLEVLEEILPGMELFIVDESGSTLKWLPLQGGSN